MSVSISDVLKICEIIYKGVDNLATTTNDKTTLHNALIQFTDMLSALNCTMSEYSLYIDQERQFSQSMKITMDSLTGLKERLENNCKSGNFMGRAWEQATFAFIKGTWLKTQLADLDKEFARLKALNDMIQQNAVKKSVLRGMRETGRQKVLPARDWTLEFKTTEEHTASTNLQVLQTKGSARNLQGPSGNVARLKLRFSGLEHAGLEHA